MMYPKVKQTFEWKKTVLIEEADQDVSIGSKWLWNTETDTTLTIRHENQSMTAVVVVHLIYLE